MVRRLDWETVTPLHELTGRVAGRQAQERTAMVESSSERGLADEPAGHSSASVPDLTASWLKRAAGPRAAPARSACTPPRSLSRLPVEVRTSSSRRPDHLEALGVSVGLFCPWTDRLDQLRRCSICSGCRARGSSWHDRARAPGNTRRPLANLLVPAGRALEAGEQPDTQGACSLAAWWLRRLAARLPGWRRELLDPLHRILPNSRAEAEQLGRLFGMNHGGSPWFPTGSTAASAGPPPYSFREHFGDDDFVLFVGRVEPRKNTLGLVNAVRALGLPPGRPGEPPRRSLRSYRDQCRRGGGQRGSNGWDHLDHEDPLLASAYAAARVLALPSWFETPGLGSRGRLAGTAVVITPFGSTREYFGDRV